MPSDPRNRLVYKGWVFEPFSTLAPQSEFDCGDPDLNEFFLRDLVPHEEQLITKTFILFPLSDSAPVELTCPVAFISFCNDAIQQKAFKTDDAKQAMSLIPIPKQYPAFPAVKIARSRC